jgi:hypothetical protein
MFFGCSNLKIAPVLPATTLAIACYYGMFRGCSKILEAPVLPATTLVTNCYNQMFRYCSKLNYIKMLATDISATSCLNNWVDGVASTGSFIKDANMTSLSIGPSGIPSGWISYNNDEDYYKDEYLTFESLEDNNVVSFKMNSSSAPVKTIEYSTDKINWTSATSTTDGTILATLNTGNKLYLRGDNTQYCTGNGNQNLFISTKKFNLSGNIMSLVSSSNFSNLTSMANLGQHTFRTMFQGTKVVDVSRLQLPATTLINGCYNGMFQGCIYLVNAPKLPATTLANHCYMQLFDSCINLTVAPELPATTMKSQCYQSMFYKCKITVAPELPATTLANYCYMGMFYNCTSLMTAPSVLPATTLKQECYKNMFYNCSKLNYIKMLATDISATDCFKNWVYGVSASGTFIKDASMTSLTIGVNGIPDGWTVQDAS